MPQRQSHSQPQSMYLDGEAKMEWDKTTNHGEKLGSRGSNYSTGRGALPTDVRCRVGDVYMSYFPHWGYMGVLGIDKKRKGGKQFTCCMLVFNLRWLRSIILIQTVLVASLGSRYRAGGHGENSWWLITWGTLWSPKYFKQRKALGNQLQSENEFQHPRLASATSTPCSN